MKASKNKNLSPSMRYKLAAIKRFTNFMFWGPPLILGSVLFIIWQYQQNPQWLLGGQGQQLAPSTQFEEPGIYDDLPEGTLSPSTETNGEEGLINSPNMPNVNPNQPSGLDPNPELEANTFTNPLIPARPKPPEGDNPGSQLPDLFLPLFPTSNQQNKANSPAPSLPSRTSPIKIEVNQESELQKAMRRRFSTSTQSNDPSSPNNPQSSQNSQTPTPQEQPNQYTYSNPNNPVTPNQGISSYNPYSQPLVQPSSPYQYPYAPQQTTPNGMYRPLPSGSSYHSGGQSNPSNRYGVQSQPTNRYGQSYTAPSAPNYGTIPNRTSPNQVPMINGRPAPQIQPSIPSNRVGY